MSPLEFCFLEALIHHLLPLSLHVIWQAQKLPSNGGHNYILFVLVWRYFTDYILEIKH